MKDLDINISYARNLFEDAYNKAVATGTQTVAIATCDLFLVVEALKKFEKEQAVLHGSAKAALHEFCKFPDPIITTAYAYAYNMAMLGIDITEKYDTACKNQDVVNAAYDAGYRACTADIIKRRQEAEHEHNDSK